MNTEIILLILVLAFICELIDSSLGMLYGTILSPVLIIAGFNPLVVVPSILFSQAIGGFVASMGHHHLKNVDFSLKGRKSKRTPRMGYLGSIRKNTTRDLKIVIVMTCFGLLATIIGALIAISIPKPALKTYIGILVFAMGIMLFLGRRFSFSWRKVYGISILSAFNKAISGGGFGPVVTAGQLISGRRTRNSIGVTTMSEAPICIVGFFTYLIRNGLPTWNLLIILTTGALAGAALGPYITARFGSEKKARVGLGILVTLLGTWTLAQTWLL